jgi:hypothetical protein
MLEKKRKKRKERREGVRDGKKPDQAWRLMPVI